MARKLKSQTLSKSKQNKKADNSPNRILMNQTIGGYLKKCRERANVTQQMVADKAGLTTAQYISNVERGISPPSMEFLRLVVEMYGLDSEELAFFISKAHLDYYRRELE